MERAALLLLVLVSGSALLLNWGQQASPISENNTAPLIQEERLPTLQEAAAVLVEEVNKEIAKPRIVNQVGLVEGEALYSDSFPLWYQRKMEYDCLLKWSGFCETGILGERLVIKRNFTSQVTACCGPFTCKLTVGLMSKICP